jgi:hypothetical protein
MCLAYNDKIDIYSLDVYLRLSPFVHRYRFTGSTTLRVYQANPITISTSDTVQKSLCLGEMGVYDCYKHEAYKCTS